MQRQAAGHVRAVDDVDVRLSRHQLEHVLDVGIVEVQRNQVVGKTAHDVAAGHPRGKARRRAWIRALRILGKSDGGGLLHVGGGGHLLQFAVLLLRGGRPLLGNGQGNGGRGRRRPRRRGGGCRRSGGCRRGAAGSGGQ